MGLFGMLVQECLFAGMRLSPLPRAAMPAPRRRRVRDTAAPLGYLAVPMLSPADRAPSTALIDTGAAAAELARLAGEYPGRERELRTAVAQYLKAALAKGRAGAEQMLLKD